MKRTALVTGGTAGIGLGIAECLAADGFEVAVTGRDPERMQAALQRLEQRAVDGARMTGLVSDLTSAENNNALIGKAVNALGRLDCLIVNSGHMPYGTVEDLTDQQWMDAFEMLMMSAVRLSRAALAQMRAQGQGDIVFVTGSEAREPAAHLVLASSFRAAIANMAKTISKNAAGSNIRVNVVAPGYFDTGRVRARADALAREKQIPREEALLLIAGDNPSGRAGDAREIGELVAFICSRKASYLNGATVVIDGGRGAASI